MPDGAGGNPSHRMRMTVAFANSMLTPPKTNSGDIDAWLVLPRVHRVVLVVDVVESVRLMEQDEEDTITRWRAFVHGVERELLPQHGGRLVKSLGDGLMLEFERVLPAVQSALAMQQLAQTMNQGRGAERCMFLRMGVHAADVVVDERDIYGAGVNLAARLATLAGPGEVVVSAEVRDELVPEVDAEVEDMGACYLKHLSQPLRTFRLQRTQPSGGSRQPPQAKIGRVSVAVLPLVAQGGTAIDATLAEVFADEVISILCKSNQWQVISRLTTSRLVGRQYGLRDVGNLLGATYVLSGQMLRVGQRCRLWLELSAAQDERVVWGTSLSVASQDLLDGGNDGPIATIAAEVGSQLIKGELSRASTSNLHNLEGQSVLLHAIAQMHRLSSAESDKARQALLYLCDRYPRSPEPRAWLAKWHFIQLAQGWSADAHLDAERARNEVNRALEISPEHALSLAIAGQVSAFAFGDATEAEQSLVKALSVNPNESLAWLFLSSVYANQGAGIEAVETATKARQLSPLDPLRYFYDIFAASAALAAGQYRHATELAHTSIRANRTHLPSYPVLIVAQALGGCVDEARATARAFLEMRPKASVARYRHLHQARPALVATYCDALLAAGIPP